MSKLRTSRVSRLVAAAVLCAVVVAWAPACPSCKAALASESAGKGDLVGGFFWSILFMLSMPFMVFGGMSGYFYYLVRKARAATAGGPPNPTA